MEDSTPPTRNSQNSPYSNNPHYLAFKDILVRYPWIIVLIFAIVGLDITDTLTRLCQSVPAITGQDSNNTERLSTLTKEDTNLQLPASQNGHTTKTNVVNRIKELSQTGLFPDRPQHSRYFQTSLSPARWTRSEKVGTLKNPHGQVLSAERGLTLLIYVRIRRNLRIVQTTLLYETPMEYRRVLVEEVNLN